MKSNDNLLFSKMVCFFIESLYFSELYSLNIEKNKWSLIIGIKFQKIEEEICFLFNACKLLNWKTVLDYARRFSNSRDYSEQVWGKKYKICIDVFFVDFIGGHCWCIGKSLNRARTINNNHRFSFVVLKWQIWMYEEVTVTLKTHNPGKDTNIFKRNLNAMRGFL